MKNVVGFFFAEAILNWIVLDAVVAIRLFEGTDQKVSGIWGLSVKQ